MADRSAHSPSTSFVLLPELSLLSHSHLVNRTLPRSGAQGNRIRKDGGTCCIHRVLMDFPRRRAHSSTHGGLQAGKAHLLPVDQEMWAHLCCPLFLSMVHAGVTVRDCPFIPPPPVDMESR